MSRRKFNELKFVTLEYLDQSGSSVTSNEVSSALGINLSNAQAIMWRLKKQQLVDKEELPRGGRTGRREFVYTLNYRGLQRLEYLKYQAA